MTQRILTAFVATLFRGVGGKKITPVNGRVNVGGGGGRDGYAGNSTNVQPFMEETGGPGEGRPDSEFARVDRRRHGEVHSTELRD